MSDKKRLTAKQVVHEIGKIRSRIMTDMEVADAACDTEEYELNEHILDIVNKASGLVTRNIIPRWQSEPDGDGWYWVEGLSGIVFCYREDDERNPWAIELVETDPETLVSVLKWKPLNNRRVCPIGERPEASV